MTIWPKLDLASSQDLSAAPLAYTTSIGRRFKLDSVSGKASVAITETVTITLDSNEGANYDVVLATISLVSKSSFVWRPEGELNLVAGDEIKVQCTNANVTGTIYPIIKTSELQS